MIQLTLNLTRHAPCTRYNTLFILLAYIHTCACEIDDVEALMQTTHVHTRRAHNKLHEHASMSVKYMPNLVHMQVDEYMNCKPRMMV